MRETTASPVPSDGGQEPTATCACAHGSPDTDAHGAWNHGEQAAFSAQAAATPKRPCIYQEPPVVPVSHASPSHTRRAAPASDPLEPAEWSSVSSSPFLAGPAPSSVPTTCRRPRLPPQLTATLAATKSAQERGSGWLCLSPNACPPPPQVLLCRQGRGPPARGRGAWGDSTGEAGHRGCGHLGKHAGWPGPPQAQLVSQGRASQDPFRPLKRRRRAALTKGLLSFCRRSSTAAVSAHVGDRLVAPLFHEEPSAVPWTHESTYL